MSTDHRWTGAHLERVAGEIREATLNGHGCHGQAAAVLDALTADGWRPPPPQSDGVHWRVGGTVGCTIYNPHGDLAGMMRTPEAAAAVVDVLNAHAEGETEAER